MCRYNFPRGKAAPTVPPAIQRNEILMLHEWRTLARTVNCTRTGASRAQGRGIIAAHSPRMCVRPLKIRWKGKKRPRYLHILRGCGKSSTCMHTPHSPRHGDVHTVYVHTRKIEYVRTAALGKSNSRIEWKKIVPDRASTRHSNIARGKREGKGKKYFRTPYSGISRMCILLRFALRRD